MDSEFLNYMAMIRIKHLHITILVGFHGSSVVKNLPANAGDIRDMGLIPGLGRASRWAWQPTPIFLLVEFHGQRIPARYGP